MLRQVGRQLRGVWMLVAPTRQAHAITLDDGTDEQHGTARRLVTTLMKARALRQTATYAGATALASVATGVAKGLLAMLLTVSGFGAFAVTQSVLEYGSMLCEFGLFLPAARAAALSDADTGREIVGAALVLYLPVAAIFVLGVVGTAFFVDGGFHVHAAEALRVTAPLAIGWPFAFVGLQLAQGVGRLHVSALTTLLGRALFLGFLVLTSLATGRMTLASALIVQDVGLLVAAVTLVIWLKPRFLRVRQRIRVLVRQARSYGFQVYVGRVLSVGTYNMDVLMLAALTNARTVAYYALAGAITSAAGLPVAGFSNALFARMVHSRQLETSWVILSWAIGLAAVPATWALARIAVGTVFADAYSPLLGLVVPLALAQVVRGVTNVYNQFLSAHGRGRELRHAAIVLTISNLALNLALIPPFGAQGAAWASLVALVANWTAHVIGYRRLMGADPVDFGTAREVGTVADESTVRLAEDGGVY
jgi:O-antigen/teichoic acid export membrane protein